MSNPPCIVEIQDELWFFPNGTGKTGGSGHLIERATPNKYPMWVIKPSYLPRRYFKVEDESLHLKLLKLPRNKHD